MKVTCQHQVDSVCQSDTEPQGFFRWKEGKHTGLCSQLLFHGNIHSFKWLCIYNSSYKIKTKSKNKSEGHNGFGFQELLHLCIYHLSYISLNQSWHVKWFRSVLQHALQVCYIKVFSLLSAVPVVLLQILLCQLCNDSHLGQRRDTSIDYSNAPLWWQWKELARL